MEEKGLSDLQYYGTGRRKTAKARVFLRPGSGQVTVNDRSFEDYFPNRVLRMVVRQPLLATETDENFDIFVTAQSRWPADEGSSQEGAQEIRPEGCPGPLPVQ